MGVFSRRDSERMAMESSHGDKANVQRIVREAFHGDTASVQRGILVLTSDKTCGVVAKQQASVRRQSESGTA